VVQLNFPQSNFAFMNNLNYALLHQVSAAILAVFSLHVIAASAFSL
jgi:hypothetical protein